LLFVHARKYRLRRTRSKAKVAEAQLPFWRPLPRTRPIRSAGKQGLELFRKARLNNKAYEAVKTGRP
jgi:hypothetical protein